MQKLKKGRIYKSGYPSIWISGLYICQGVIPVPCGDAYEEHGGCGGLLEGGVVRQNIAPQAVHSLHKSAS